MRKPLVIFKENLVKFIEESGLSQTEIAKRAGIPLPALNRYVKGVTEPKINVLEPIARALGVTVAQLITEQPDEKTAEFQGALSKVSEVLTKIPAEIVELYVNSNNPMKDQLVKAALGVGPLQKKEKVGKKEVKKKNQLA